MAALFVGGAFAGAVIGAAGSIHCNGQIPGHLHTLGKKIRHVQPTVVALRDRVGGLQVAKAILTEDHPLHSAGSRLSVQGHLHRDLTHGHARRHLTNGDQNIRRHCHRGHPRLVQRAAGQLQQQDRNAKQCPYQFFHYFPSDHIYPILWGSLYCPRGRMSPPLQGNGVGKQSPQAKRLGG